MEYITFMHGNSDGKATPDEWNTFFELARDSGLFRGGSEIGERFTVGRDAPVVMSTVAGYMRFDADDLDELLALLQNHPTILHGGTIEVCELPKS